MPFRDVIGHRRLVRLLSKSVAGDTLPPSLLFAGPAGVGKRLTAVATAQAVNCLNARVERAPADTDSIPVDACGVCAACSRIRRNVHPDVLVVEPGDTGSIKIEQVRDVVDRAAYRPFEGRRRVVIVDEADALAAPAQNALLKTLEEPPPSSVFFLITSRPDMLLPTVVSRCPRLRFRPLSSEDVARVLVAQGQSEANAHAVAAMAEGSVGRAIEVRAEEIVEAREVAQQVLARAGASDDPAWRIEGAKDLLAGTGAGRASDREQLATHLRAMASLVRDVELLSTRADVRGLANPDVQPALERLARTFHGERGVRAFTAIDRALAALDRNAGVKSVADWVVMNL